MRAVKNITAALQLATLDLITHMRRDTHIAALAGSVADFHNGQGTTIAEDALIPRTQTGVQIGDYSFPLSAVSLRFLFQARYLFFCLDRLFGKLSVKLFEARLDVGELLTLLFKLLHHTQDTLFNLTIRLFHQLDFTLEGELFAFIPYPVQPHPLFFDLFFFQLELSIRLALLAFQFADALLPLVGLLLPRLLLRPDAGNLLMEVFQLLLFLLQALIKLL
jgi:hypothetical protein